MDDREIYTSCFHRVIHCSEMWKGIFASVRPGLHSLKYPRVTELTAENRLNVRFKNWQKNSGNIAYSKAENTAESTSENKITVELDTLNTLYGSKAMAFSYSTSGNGLRYASKMAYSKGGSWLIVCLNKSLHYGYKMPHSLSRKEHIVRLEKVLQYRLKLPNVLWKLLTVRCKNDIKQVWEVRRMKWLGRGLKFLTVRLDISCSTLEISVQYGSILMTGRLEN